MTYTPAENKKSARYRKMQLKVKFTPWRYKLLPSYTDKPVTYGYLVS